jgi:hypothetical protein
MNSQEHFKGLFYNSPFFSKQNENREIILVIFNILARIVWLMLNNTFYPYCLIKTK